jgi:hypothetical protein
MNNSDKKDTLKNKFQVAEIAADPDMKYKINEAMYQAMVKEREGKRKFSYFWFNSLARSMKILFKVCLSFTHYVWNDLTRPFFSFMSKKITSHSISFYSLLREKKEKKEILIEDFLLGVESKINSNEAKLKLDDFQNVNVFQEYENSIRKKFDDGLCNAAVNAEENEYKGAMKSLDFDKEIFDYLATRLKDSRLMANVEYMTVITTVEKLEVKHVIEFELKISGHSWSTVFSKFISSQVHQKIEWVKGKTGGHHSHNMTLMKDTFTFIFSHQRLELHDEIIEPKKTVESKEIPNIDFEFEFLSNNLENQQEM